MAAGAPTPKGAGPGPLAGTTVLDLSTVPRRASTIARNRPQETERLAEPFVRSVERVYGIRPEVEGS